MLFFEIYKEKKQ